MILLTADLLTKTMAFRSVAPEPVVLTSDASEAGVAIPPHGPSIILPKVLALQLTVNDGAVFGLGGGGRWVFVVFSLVAVVAIATVFHRTDPAARVSHLALAAVLAGALGNLYDRLRYGVVRDFLLLFPDVKLPFGWHWPNGSEGLYPWIFNLADAYLLVSLGVLMIVLCRQDREAAKAVDENHD